MKYKLKKDLPFAKAGAEVTIKFSEAFTQAFDEKRTLWLKNENVLRELLLMDWIEEVKPREFYISERLLKVYSMVYEKDLFSEDVARDIIKVKVSD